MLHRPTCLTQSQPHGGTSWPGGQEVAYWPIVGALETPWTPLALVPRQPHRDLGSPNCSPTRTEAQEGYLLMGHPTGECSTSQPSHHRTRKTVLLPMKCPVVRQMIRNVAALVAPKHTPQTHAQGPRNNPANPLPLSNSEVRKASAMGPERAISSVSEMRTLRIRAGQCTVLSQTGKETPSPNLPPRSPVLKVLTILCKLSISKTPAPFCPRYT